MELIYFTRKPKNMRKAIRMLVVDAIKKEDPYAVALIGYTPLFTFADYIAQKYYTHRGKAPTEEEIFDEYEKFRRCYIYG